MAAVTAGMVKELREMTGAGMMDCKKALAATDGDMDKAVEFLREKGLAGAAKKAGRIAAEGIVATALSEDEKKAVVVEVNAETDFVAKNEKFRSYVADVAAQALTTTAADLDGFMAEKWAKDETLTVKEALASQIAIIGENMNIRRFEQVEEPNGFVASYIHAGGKIGVLVDVETNVVNDAVKEMAKNVAMQAAALKPMFTSRDEVSADYLAKETEILTAAAKNEKPDANDKIIEGMVKGRINKELKEICLLDQVYVKAEDGKQSVAAYVASVAKANGADIKVKKFVRFETGEGLEKKEENFAEEVAKQMGTLPARKRQVFFTPNFYSGPLKKFQAFPTDPNNSIFSFTLAMIASVPGFRSLRGSNPLPCRSLPSSIYLRVASANTSWHSVFTLIFATPRSIAFLIMSSGMPVPP